MMSRSVLIAGLLTAASSAQVVGAQTSAAPSSGRVSSLVVYGSDPCPKGDGDEVVVCARRPEGERYRLPKRFRDKAPGVAQESWTNRAETLDAASSRVLPGSCSPIGSYGQSGCYHQFLAGSRAERRADRAEAAAIP